MLFKGVKGADYEYHELKCRAKFQRLSRVTPIFLYHSGTYQYC